MIKLNDTRALNILMNFAQYNDGTVTLAAEKYISKHMDRCLTHNSNNLRLIPIASFYRILKYPELKLYHPENLKKFIVETTLFYNQDFRILYELIPEKKTNWTKIIGFTAAITLSIIAIRYAYPTIRDIYRKISANRNKIQMILDLVDESDLIDLQNTLAARNFIQNNTFDHRNSIIELQNENNQLTLTNKILSVCLFYFLYRQFNSRSQ